LHLTSEETHPERFETLQLLLEQCAELGVDRLLIAGDLFDRRQQNFGEFESRLRSARPSSLEVLIIPGNHDAGLTSGSLAVEGVTVFSEATLLTDESGFQLLFVPYRAGRTMGQMLAATEADLEPDQWALVSHGDWMGGRHQPSADEPGVYMPLTRTDLALFQPEVCLLGHIHRPGSEGKVYYAGSPCPLDVTETGLRRLLLFDTLDRSVSSKPVSSPRLYFDETVVVLPLKDELDYLEKQLLIMINGWEIPPAWQDRARVRLKLTGFARNRAALLNRAEAVLSDFQMYPGSPDVSDLREAVDVDRNEIARKVQERIQELGFEPGGRDPEEWEILEQALGVIYGL
jgi:DNA repair exonuclease SbcCD nuclease subunit